MGNGGWKMQGGGEDWDFGRGSLRSSRKQTHAAPHFFLHFPHQLAHESGRVPKGKRLQKMNLARSTELATTFRGGDDRRLIIASAAGSGRSTRGASKQRRDQINRELDALRQLLPLDRSTRERLFQLQVISLGCIYIRKAATFLGLFPSTSSDEKTNKQIAGENAIGCRAHTEALHDNFLLAFTREGKLLALSENFATGSPQITTEEWMAQSDSLFDLIDPRDHSALNEALENVDRGKNDGGERRMAFACRWRAPKLGGVTKRQADWDGKPTLVEGQLLVTRPNTAADGVTSSSTTIMAICRPLASTHKLDLPPPHPDPTICRLSLGLDFGILSICANTKSQLDFLRPRPSFAAASSAVLSLYHFVHPHCVPKLAQLHGKILEQNSSNRAFLLLLTLSNPADCSLRHFHAHFQRKATAANSVQAILQQLSHHEAVALDKADWLYNNGATIEKAAEGRGEGKVPSKLAKKNGQNKKEKKQQMDGGKQPEFLTAPAFPFPRWDMVAANCAQQKQTMADDKRPDLNNNNLMDGWPLAAEAEEEAATSLLFDDLPSFVLPQLDDRDLDEFFRQVEQRGPMGKNCDEAEEEEDGEEGAKKEEEAMMATKRRRTEE